MEAVVEKIGGCFSTRAEYKTCKLFSFGWNFFRINASYDNESSHYYRCFGSCCSTETDSGEWKLFWKKLEDVPILQLSLKHRSFFRRG
uniref:Fibrinogen C-terminal domain-containing protein n=1 Tax=Strongyloides stercoralis TaxID=6248 RepID=A0A0K0ERQ8_STRER